MLGLSVPLILALAFGLYVGSYLLQWIRNYFTAHKIGLPVHLLPIDQNSFVWMISSVASRPFLKKHLPESVYNRLTLGIYGWEHHQKLAPFPVPKTNSKNSSLKGGGKSFILSGCGRMELWTCDPEVAKDILARPKDFQQFDMTELFVGQFGPNVLSSDGDVWSRHRRVVASAVTERVSPVVWAESIRQTTGLIDEVFEKSSSKDGKSAETRRLFDMMKKITIHVLSGAGMGTTRSWNDNEESEINTETAKDTKKKPMSKFKLSYIEGVKMINENMTGPLILPIKVLINWPSFMPAYQNMRKLGYAKQEFPLRTKDMLAQEKDRAAEEKQKGNTEPRNNVMSMLIAASEQGDEEAQVASTKRKGPALSDDEIVGNLYVFTAAGFDTTANTLSYALVLLARYPKWQEWLYEEIDSLLADDGADSDNEKLADYSAVFPKVTRVLAFMFETLRLFSPLSHLVKMVKQPTTVTTSLGETLTLPAPLTVYVNLVALHLDPQVWRDLNLPPANSNNNNKAHTQLTEDDAPGRHAAAVSGIKQGELGDEWMFRPTRWINNNDNNKTQTLYQPPRNAYMPWSMGPRVCPGQRMAQVEFTAIFLALFRKHRIEVAKQRVPAVAGKVGKKGEEREETDDEVNARVDKLMEESMSILTLEMPIYNITSEAEQKGLQVRLVKRR